jgi:hypothetical protein
VAAILGFTQHKDCMLALVLYLCCAAKLYLETKNLSPFSILFRRNEQPLTAGYQNTSLEMQL